MDQLSGISQGKAQLTERENEVAKLIAYGHSNKECAAKLDVSVHTIETHKAHIMEKLGIRSRVQLVQLALDCGWLQASPLRGRPAPRCSLNYKAGPNSSSG